MRKTLWIMIVCGLCAALLMGCYSVSAQGSNNGRKDNNPPARPVPPSKTPIPRPESNDIEVFWYYEKKDYDPHMPPMDMNPIRFYVQDEHDGTYTLTLTIKNLSNRSWPAGAYQLVCKRGSDYLAPGSGPYWTITEDDKSNINHIYTMIAGTAGGGSYSGEFLRGDGSSIDLDISTFVDPANKNAADLVTYATHAWESGWGYVWGTYGNVLTESLLTYKVSQYPDGVGNHEDIIRANWLGGRTADCVGLIKGYSWLSPETMTIDYGTHGMRDIGANQMYYSATESGPIDTMPDIPGLAVWHEGHIGVYIGGGQVIEAMGTKYGVVKTELAKRNWTHWLKVPYISYD